MKRFFQKRGVKIFLLSLLGVIILIFCYFLRFVFNPLLLSLLIAYILSPIVDFFEKKKIPRVIVIFILYIVLLGVVAYFLSVAIPFLIGEVGDIIEMVPSFIESCEGTLERVITIYNENFATTQEDELNKEKIQLELESWLEANKERLINVGKDIVGEVFSAAISSILTMISVFMYLVLVPMFTFFFLKEMNNMRDKIYEYLPGKHKARIVRILSKIHESASSFFRGRLVICIVVAILTTIGLAICDVKFALILGILTGIGIMIPFASFIVGLIPAWIILAVDGGTLFQFLGATSVFLVVQALEQFVLTPWILGKAVELHPITLIVSIFIGGELFGFFGVLLVVPVVSILKILGQEFVLPVLREFASEKPEEDSASGGKIA